MIFYIFKKVFNRIPCNQHHQAPTSAQTTGRCACGQLCNHRSRFFLNCHQIVAGVHPRKGKPEQFLRVNSNDKFVVSKLVSINVNAVQVVRMNAQSLA